LAYHDLTVKGYFVPIRYETVRYPMAIRTVEVVRTRRITPSMVRVMFSGEELKGFESRSAEDHFRMLFPQGGYDAQPVLPVWGPDGPKLPDGVARPQARDYTPVAYDETTNELTVDFFVHGAGVGSSWAAQAKAGQFIGIAGPRGSHIAAYTASWYVLAGDETSIPTIRRRLDELPEDARIFVFVEVANAGEEQSLPTRANATIAWLHRDEAAGDPTIDDRGLVECALEWFEFPEGEGFVFATGESNGLKSLRRYLLNKRGLPKENLSFSGHWKKNTADYDHHETIDDEA
jgi:NADPH-dependent ferric siderophore reductase